MRKPNFFVLGAPKCGTTSIAFWLSEHPEIYISPIKEPNFFNTDDRIPGRLSSEEYERLFDKVESHHVAIGEASAQYLASAEAVPNILKYCDEQPKFIVCVRNPIEMAISLHSYLIQHAVEDITDFQLAWRQQWVRQTQMPTLLRFDNKEVLYGERCKLGIQLETLYQKIDSSKVIVILLDDIRLSPEREYEKITKFLGVRRNSRTVYPALNTAKTVKWPAVSKVLRFFHIAKSTLGIRISTGFGRKIQALNTRAGSSYTELQPDFHDELKSYFKGDISLLSNLISRDLSHWLE